MRFAVSIRDNNCHSMSCLATFWSRTKIVSFDDLENIAMFQQVRSVNWVYCPWTASQLLWRNYCRKEGTTLAKAGTTAVQTNNCASIFTKTAKTPHKEQCRIRPTKILGLRSKSTTHNFPPCRGTEQQSNAGPEVRIGTGPPQLRPQGSENQ